MTSYDLPQEVLRGSNQHPEGKIYFHRLKPDSAWRDTVKSQCGYYFDYDDKMDSERVLDGKHVPCSRNGCFPGWWRIW